MKYKPQYKPLVTREIDENIRARLKSITNIQEIGLKNPEDVKEHIPALIEGLKDEDEGVRFWTALTIGMIGRKDPEVVKDTIPTLIDRWKNDKITRVRVGCIEAIKNIGLRKPEYVKDVIPSIAKRFEDEGEGRCLRTWYGSTLADIGGNYPEYVKDVIPTLVRVLGDKNDVLRYLCDSALRIVAMQKPEYVVPVLKKGLKARNQLVKNGCEEILNDLES